MKGSRDQLQNSGDTWKLQVYIVKLLFLSAATADHNVPGTDRPENQNNFGELEVNGHFFFSLKTAVTSSNFRLHEVILTCNIS